jgi:hypothetical protein
MKSHVHSFCLLLLLPLLQAQPPPDAWLAALLSHAEEQLEEMAPQHLAMMLIGLAKMQVGAAKGKLLCPRAPSAALPHSCAVCLTPTAPCHDAR